jgi:hypothetical protein
MGAPSALTFYRAFKKYMADGTFDLDGNTFKAMLLTSAYSPDVENDDIKADIVANEVANGNGYTTGGVALGSVTWTRATTTVTFDAADAAWTGSGAGFSARYLAIYASGTLNGHTDPLVGYVLLDSAPADVSFAAGNTVTVQWNASGIFTLA